MKKYFNPNTGLVPVYQKPEFSSGKITEVLYGESCEILSRDGKWLEIIQDDSYEGWVNAFYGFETENIFEATHVFTGNTIVKKIGNQSIHIPLGARFLKQNGQFLNARGDAFHQLDGLTNLDKDPAFDEIIPLSKILLGIPYRWGGKSSFGFDCSGLIQTVCRACGIQLPRDAWQQQEALASSQISLESAKPGDIHFFGEGEKATHVGFSLDGKGILHAQGWVKEESLDPKSPIFNASLLDIYLSSHSIRSNFQP